jgi:hypothetical protein
MAEGTGAGRLPTLNARAGDGGSNAGEAAGRGSLFGRLLGAPAPPPPLRARLLGSACSRAAGLAAFHA